MTMRQGCLVGNTGEFLHTALGGGGKQDVWYVSNTQLLVKSKTPFLDPLWQDKRCERSLAKSVTQPSGTHSAHSLVPAGSEIQSHRSGPAEIHLAL